MANSTLVGFTSTTNSNQCVEIQPLTTWTRDGNYRVTRRWRGPVDSLKNFSDGGSGNADSAGTYFTGASGILPGGAGMDGAISTDLARDEGGELGIFSATWVSSSLTSVLGDPRAAGRTGTSGDQYQDSSLWFLDGNDLEKSIWECPAMKAIINEIGLNADGSTDPVKVKQRNGFAGRVQAAIDEYRSGKDKDSNDVVDYYEHDFNVQNYFDKDVAPYDELSGNDNPETLSKLVLKQICEEVLKGVEAFTVSQYVLRNTVTIQYASTVGAQVLAPYYIDVNKIWATSDITTAMAAQTRPIDPPTSTVAFTLPLIGLLSGSPFSSYKWLYRTPDVQQLGNGKWQITREWWETTDFSTVLYSEK